jgi:hypothetical protein
MGQGESADPYNHSFTHTLTVPSGSHRALFCRHASALLAQST